MKTEFSVKLQVNLLAVSYHLKNNYYCPERSEGLYMFMNLNDILDHVAMSVCPHVSFLIGFWISCTYWTLKGRWVFCIRWTLKVNREGFPDFLYITDFKGTPGFCTHWTFKGTWFHFFILFS
ncbi:unnamed protein product [Rhizophagus irregularis]|nr:unnamed protein product [Rhizophagus irregularis]